MSKELRAIAKASAASRGPPSAGPASEALCDLRIDVPKEDPGLAMG